MVEGLSDGGVIIKTTTHKETIMTFVEQVEGGEGYE